MTAPKTEKDHADPTALLRELLFQLAVFNEHIRSDSRSMVALAAEVRGIDAERQEKVAHDLLNHLSRVQGGSMSIASRVQSMGRILSALADADPTFPPESPSE